MGMDFLQLLARLIRPGARDAAYVELRRFLSDDAISEISSVLKRREYDYRNNGLRACYAKAEIDEYILKHDFNQVNPYRLMALVNTYLEIETFDVRGKDVLDFGSGRCNPLGFSLLMYVNGAARCVGYEPFGIDKKLSDVSRKELVFAILEDPSQFRFSDISIDEMRQRVCSPNIHLATAREDVTGSFHYVFSRSVLEHVDDVEAEARFLNRVCSGKQVHRVDFSDHRFAHENYEPFLYMKDGVLHTINGLLFSEISDALQAGGLKIEKSRTVKAAPAKNPTGRYKNMQETDAGVVLADFVLTGSS